MSLLNEEYQNFKGQISFKKICIGEEETWCLYDAGPRSVTSPIIFLPPVSGRADVYFLQLTCLSRLGYRAISIEYPVFWDIKSFCISFHNLLNTLKLEKVHLFGSAIGGFLAMKYGEFTRTSPRVQSIILCNSFTDSSIFCSRIPAIPKGLFWLLPSVILRKLVMSDFDRRLCDKRTRDSIELMKHSLYSMTQEELASRLFVNCTGNYVQPQYLRNVNIMIMEVNDCDAIGQEVMEETHKCFPDAKVAQIKSGGNFPFLSRYDDVNVFIQIHLNQYMSKLDCMPVDKNGDLASIAREAELMESPAVSPTPKIISPELKSVVPTSVVISPVAPTTSQDVITATETTSSISEPIPSMSEPVQSTSERASSTIKNADASEKAAAIGVESSKFRGVAGFSKDISSHEADEFSVSRSADIPQTTSETLLSKVAEAVLPTSENATPSSEIVALKSAVVTATSGTVGPTSEVVSTSEAAVPALEAVTVMSEMVAPTSKASISTSEAAASTSEAISVAAECFAETSVLNSATSESMVMSKSINSSSDTVETSQTDDTTDVIRPNTVEQTFSIVDTTVPSVNTTHETSSATSEIVESSSPAPKASNDAESA